MKIFEEAKKEALAEKSCMRRLLGILVVIDKDKLYVDLKYPSLHKYIIKELGFSEAEATLRVNAVRLMRKSTEAQEKILSGKLSLTNAALAGKVLKNEKDKKTISKLIQVASGSSTRKLKTYLEEKFEIKRKESLVLEGARLQKFDRLRKIYGEDLSNYEVLDILLEEKLKGEKYQSDDLYKKDDEVQRVQQGKRSRYIPMSIKRQAYTGKCAHCGSRTNLEFDHKLKHSHGGKNTWENIQLLCRSCNQRKEIKARQMNVFI